MIENKRRYIYLKCVLSLAIVFIIHAAKATGKSVKPTLQSALPSTKLKPNPCIVDLTTFSVSLAPTCNPNLTPVSAWAKATTVFVFGVCVCLSVIHG